MDATSGVAAQLAQTRQNAAFSGIRQNAQAEQQIANVVQESAEAIAVPGSPVRGTNVDLRA